MNESTTLSIAVRNHDKTSIEIEPTATTAKESALMDAESIFCVQCADDQIQATKAIQKINALLKQVEASRKLCKSELEKPIKALDTLAKEFSASLIEVRDRLAGWINSYQIEQQRIAAAAEKERQEKLRREMAEAERIRREAEEAKRKAERAETEFAGKDAEEQARREAEAKRQELARQQQALANTQTTRTATPPKAAGMVVKEVIRFDVTDIHALYAHNPKFVRMEPNAIEINSALRNGMSECPGLKIWKETKTEFRQ